MFISYRCIGNYRMYEAIDETAIQVLLVTEPEDSIRSVAQRIQTPYETVRQAVNQLESAGFVEYDRGLRVTDQQVRNIAFDLIAISACISPPSIEEAYVIPHFGEWSFAFTRIDAVFVWTRGGYQVGREPDDYPLFLTVQEQDVDLWESFFQSFGIPTAFERQSRGAIECPLQIVLDPRESFSIEQVEGYPVISRAETISYMHEHDAHFQSAFSMLE